MTVIDMSVVDELLDLCDDGDPELLLDLIEMFLEDGPARIKSILEGVEQNDLDMVERAAHSLKGSAGNLGALKVQNDADALQNASRRSESEKVSDLVTPLQDDYREAEEALRALVTKYKV